MRISRQQAGKWAVAVTLPWLVIGTAFAQIARTSRGPVEDAWKLPIDRGSAETWQALKKLRTRASLLMIVAHPDDEDGGTLAYESRGLGVRTDLLTLNRGEGGANVMSADLWDALGLVRTEELLQAGRYYGLDGQYFTAVADYGFSKSLAEANQKWNHDRVLEQVVRVVRQTRPLILCSVFVGGPTDGHGNHAMAGLMAQEAFKAAGDPAMFPEQIKKGLRPWAPLKVYARRPFFRTSANGSYDYANHSWGPLGVTNHVTGKWEPGQVETTLSIMSGTYDPVLGESYVQIAREGLGFKKSQNGGAEIPLAGPQSSDYHRFGSHIHSLEKESSFFDGVDVSLGSIASLAGTKPLAWLSRGLAEIDAHVTAATTAFGNGDSTAISADLAAGLKRTESLLAEVERATSTRGRATGARRHGWPAGHCRLGSRRSPVCLRRDGLGRAGIGHPDLRRSLSLPARSLRSAKSWAPHELPLSVAVPAYRTALRRVWCGWPFWSTPAISPRASLTGTWCCLPWPCACSTPACSIETLNPSALSVSRLPASSSPHVAGSS